MSRESCALVPLPGLPQPASAPLSPELHNRTFESPRSFGKGFAKSSPLKPSPLRSAAGPRRPPLNKSPSETYPTNTCSQQLVKGQTTFYQFWFLFPLTGGKICESEDLRAPFLDLATWAQYVFSCGRSTQFKFCSKLTFAVFSNIC